MAITSRYNVVTRFSADTQQMQNGVNRATDETRGLNRQLRGAEERASMLGTALKAAAGGAVALGLGMAARRAFQLTKNLDNARIAMSSLFTQNDLVGDFTEGLKVAETTIDSIRDRMAESPGTAMQGVQFAKQVLPSFAGMGGTPEGLAEFSQRGVGLATVLGIPQQEAASQIQQILLGQSGADNPLFQMIRGQLMETSGAGSVEEINKLMQNSPEEGLAVMSQVMSQYDEANTAFSESWEGAFSTLQSSFDDFLLNTSEPLFESMTNHLVELNKWIEENDGSIEAFARSVGDKLTRAFEALASVTQVAAQNMDLIVAGVATLTALRAAGAVSNIATSIGGSPGFANMMSKGGNAMGEIRAGPRRLAKRPGQAASAGVSKVGDWIFGNMGMDDLGKAMLPGAAGAGSGAAAGGGGLLSSLPAIGSALGTIASVAAVVIVPLMMVIGAFRTIRSETGAVAVFFHDQVENLLLQLDILANQMGFGEGGLAGAAATVWEWIVKLTDRLGEGTTMILGGLVGALGKMVEGFNMLITVFRGFFMGIAEMTMRIEEQGVSALFQEDFFGESMRQGMLAAEQDQREAEEQEENRRQEEQEEEEEDAEDSEDNGGENIEVTVIQNIETEANPDRIALRTGEMVRDTLSRRRSTAGMPGG